jgi:hypothetical protein
LEVDNKILLNSKLIDYAPVDVTEKENYSKAYKILVPQRAVFQITSNNEKVKQLQKIMNEFVEDEKKLMKVKLSIYTDKMKRNLDREIERVQEELENLSQVFLLEEEEEMFSTTPKTESKNQVEKPEKKQNKDIEFELNFNSEDDDDLEISKVEESFEDFQIRKDEDEIISSSIPIKQNLSKKLDEKVEEKKETGSFSAKKFSYIENYLSFRDRFINNNKN